MRPGSEMIRADADVLVVGGGPVGLAAAIEGRLAGLSVLVIEPRAGSVDKACGEGLMPGTVSALRNLGVGIQGAPFRGVRYVAPNGRTTATHHFSAGTGMGVRRTALHAALAQRAADVGVVRQSGRVVGLRPTGAPARVVVALDDGSAVEGGWVLGCDGLHSVVRRETGLARGSDGRRFGIRRHAALAPWSDVVEVHWSALGEAYVTPISATEVGIAVLGPRGWSFDEALGSFPALARRLADVAWTTSARGAGPLQQKVSSPVRGRVLLVGDAAGYVDALTGEGLRIGLACAQAAVRCVAAGRPLDYPYDWRSLTRDYRWLTSGLVTTTRVPLARRLLVPVAARLPRVFGAAVERLAR
ncbi:MAG: NAD(P)/FAD-dependent oxidoreductase [Actinomycetota bacterium]|nr:NAD(P)/FAD-dependent oxidoreductase [Actinomycetota bacterium]